jgi:DNA-binding SARP family transcriptional activator
VVATLTRVLTSGEPAAVPAMNLSLIGSFRLVVGGQPVWLSPGSQRLLALLALRNGRATRASATQTLWPGLPGALARANCRAAWHGLIRQCGPVVAAGTGSLRLEPAVAVDIRQVASVARRLLDPSCDLDQAFLTSSLGYRLYADLLPSWHDDWLAAERARFRQLRLHGLEALARRLAAADQYGAAAEAMIAALQSLNGMYGNELQGA